MDILASSSELHNAVLGALVLNVSGALSWQLQAAIPPAERGWRWSTRVGSTRFAIALVALGATHPMGPDHSPWIDALPFLDPLVLGSAAAAALVFSAGEAIARRKTNPPWMAFPALMGVAAGAIAVSWFFGVMLHFATGAGPGMQAVASVCLYSAWAGLIACFGLMGGHLAGLAVRRALRGVERDHRPRLVIAAWCVVVLSLVAIAAVRWIAPEHAHFKLHPI